MTNAELIQKVQELERRIKDLELLTKQLGRIIRNIK